MDLHVKSSLSGDELRARIKRLEITYAEAAERLGLSLGGLNKQMHGTHKVSRQTATILAGLESAVRREINIRRRRGEAN
jgi:hypothetical protein